MRYCRRVRVDRATLPLPGALPGVMVGLSFLLLLAGFSLACSTVGRQVDLADHRTRALLAVQKVRRGGTTAGLPDLPGAREVEIEALRGPGPGLDQALNRVEVEALRSLVEAHTDRQAEARTLLVLLGLGTMALGVGLGVRVSGLGRSRQSPSPPDDRTAERSAPKVEHEPGDDLEGLVGALPVATVVADTSGRVVMANPAAESLAGSPLVGEPLEAIAPAPGEGWQRVPLEATGRVALLLCPAGPRPDVEARTPVRPRPPGFEELTAREQEIFGMIIQGLSNREIGEALVISEGTVKSHVNRLLRKLDLRDRVHVLLYAANHDMLAPQSGRSFS